MDRVISLIRRPEGLKALVGRSGNDIESGIDSSVDLSYFYEIFEAPLESVKEDQFSKKSKLILSWNQLADVRQWDADILYHLLVVLLETAPFFTKTKAQPADLDFGKAPEPHQPTAAHPRAYRGTISRPPKAKSPPVTDIRAHICNQRTLKIILNHLALHWAKAISMLVRDGYASGALPSGFTLDPYHGYHHPQYSSKESDSLPDGFTYYLAPSLRGLSWPVVLKYLGYYWNLSLDENEPLILAMSIWFGLRVQENNLKWMEILANQPPDQRTNFTTLLVETQAYRMAPEDTWPLYFKRFSSKTPVDKYSPYLHAFLEALKNKIDPAYILAGFKLAQKYYHDYSFSELRGGVTPFPVRLIENLHAHFKKAGEFSGYDLMTVWKRCGDYPGLVQILEHTNWTGLSPDAACQYLKCCLYSCHYLHSEDDRKAKWNFIYKHFNLFENHLWKVDESYREKFIQGLECALVSWDETNELTDCLPAALQIFSRLAREPFKKRHYADDIITDLVTKAEGDLRDVLKDAPDSSFLNLEKACRSKNQARLIECGLWALMNVLRQERGDIRFLLDCFVHFPGKLLKTAGYLGSLIVHLRYFTVKEFCRHPLMGDDLKKLPLAARCERVQPFIQNNITNPVPKKLQEYLKGEIELTETRLVRYAEKMWKNLYLTRLDILEEMITAALKNEYPVNREDGDWRHTMQIVHGADGNRRALRRFLKAHLQGDRDYPLEHPETRTWLKKHQRLDLNLWRQGIKLTRNTNKYGRVIIQIERDPEEVLKMGTYAGSCLALGGGLEYSAAAAVLDINKQVLYARDGNNKVLARQLIAVSEKDNLVCFHPYPENIPPSIKEMFHEYDLELARALGLDIFHGESDDGYVIEFIIAREWWDDGHWDPNNSQDS